MAKIIRFPLKMKNGIEVRTIEEFRENFDMDAVLENYTSGKLDTWLRGRYYDNIANAIKSLDDNAEDFYVQLCGTLGVEYQEQQHTSVSEAQHKQEKLQRFRQLSGDERYIDKIEQIAMDQNDLEDLLRQGENEIYLYRGEFVIPLTYEGIKYIGIENPIIIIRAEDNVNYKEKNLNFIDSVFGWDVSGVGEADEVFRAEQMLMKNDWRNALPILKKHAENNHPRAIVLLEKIYCSYTAQNDQKSYYGKKGIEIGNVQSHLMGSQGRVEKHLSLLRKMAESGNSFDEWLCGYAFWCDGYYNNQNFDANMMFRYLDFAAEKGNLYAISSIAACYYGYGVSQDYNIAAEMYQKAAECGYPDAQNMMGCIYDNGQGVTQDSAMAFEWFKKAADQGNVTAQGNVGLLYENGRGVQKDAVKAEEWYRKSADQGSAWSQYQLGEFYNSQVTEMIFSDHNDNSLEAMLERHTKQQELKEKALEYYMLAANQNHADAQVRVGESFDCHDENGIKWYRKAADQGNANAQSILGNCYEFGNGVEKNLEKAFEWYLKSAKNGDKGAQYCLGMFYEKGYVGACDIEKAVYWYEKAAAQGVMDAQNCLNNIQLGRRNSPIVIDGSREPTLAERIKWKLGF